MFKRFTNRKRFLAAAMLLCLCAFTNKVMGQMWDTGVGNNGAALTATLSGIGNDRTLTFDGNGLMADFQVSSGGVPWKDYLTNIRYVVINSGVQSIGDYAFSGCTNLTSVTFANPNSLTRIGYRSFYNCSNLPSITIPNGITTIEGEAFFNCTGLKTVIIEEGSTDLSFIRYPTSYSTTYYYGWFANCPIQTLELKRQYSYDSGGTLFRGNNYLQTLTIGRNVTSIGSFVFADCSSLTDVTFQDGTTGLAFAQGAAETVFGGCPINTLYLGRAIGWKTSTGLGAFSDGYKSPFYNKTALKTLTVGNEISVTPYSFQICTGLTTVNIGNSVTSIGNYAFDGCSSLSNLTIGNNVVSIDNYAFRNCSALKSISFPNKIASLGNYAFSGAGLTNISIPNTITSIGNYVFADCSSLTDVTFQDGTTGLAFAQGGAETVFGGCPINTLYLGRAIGWMAYAGLVSFDTGYKSPFYNRTTLKTLTVGKDMTTISNYAFQGCSGLTQITSDNPAPPTFGTYTFNGVVTTIPVKVPCVLAYQSSAWGTTFSNFEQTGTCPSSPTTYTLNVLSINTAYGHATSTSMLSGAVLTSTWNFDGNLSTATSAQFSGKAFLVASAKTNSVFLGWNDGNLEPMRIVNITDNKTYTANFAVSSSSGTEEVRAATNISVYPNPTKDRVTVELPENTVGTLALFDLNGKIVRNQSVNGNITTIDTASLSAGTYILRLVQNGVASSGVKIMKE